MPSLCLLAGRLVFAGQHHADLAPGAVFVLDRLVGVLQALGVFDHTVRTGPPLGFFGDARAGTADVEGPQGELRSRLADRLRREDADRLAHVHHVHGGQVAAVAHPADAAPGLAGEHRANLDLLDAGVLDGVRGLLVDQLAGLHQQLRISVLVELVRIEDIFSRDAAEDALLQRLDDVLAFLQRSDLEAEDGSAILFGDRHILRDVHEAAGEVTGVRRLERGVGQTLTCAVGRDEVLEHGQSFAEVRLDRAFDDLADASGQLLLRLRHQSAHTGELTDLVARTA